MKLLNTRRSSAWQPVLCATAIVALGVAAPCALAATLGASRSVDARSSGYLAEVAGANGAGLRQVALNGDPSDSDSDGATDAQDNCTQVANPDQLDTDGDGYGNICDGDLDNSGLTTDADFSLLRSVLNQPSTASALAAAADMNGSGTVTAADFNLLRAQINKAPGPSGLHP